MLGSFVLPVSVKFLVKLSGSYFNILLHLNKTKPAILKDVCICWIVLLQPMMLLNVSKFKHICKCSRSEPKWKVLTKSLDVYDRKWGMKLWEENNLVVVAYLSSCGKRKMCNLKLFFFSSSFLFLLCQHCGVSLACLFLRQIKCI